MDERIAQIIEANILNNLSQNNWKINQLNKKVNKMRFGVAGTVIVLGAAIGILTYKIKKLEESKIEEI